MKAGTRPYRQGARAEAAKATRERILDAAAALFWDRDYADISLEDIAAAAEVTLQTVLRKFGSKDGLYGAAIEERGGAVMDARTPAAPGPRAAVLALVASYEQMGDASWRMLRQEHQQPLLATMLARARALHRAWIETSFAAELPARGAARARTIDLLFTALDFYVWKLHRRDLGRGKDETAALMLRLVESILAGTRRQVG